MLICVPLRWICPPTLLVPKPFLIPWASECPKTCDHKTWLLRTPPVATAGAPPGRQALQAPRPDPRPHPPGPASLAE